MRRLRKLTAVVLGVIAATFILVTPASAAGGTKTCPPSTILEPSCDLDLYPTVFPGGTISIDVDVTGSSGAIGKWILAINGGRVCEASYSYNDPPRSWTCSNVPRGVPFLSAARPYFETARIALRW